MKKKILTLLLVLVMACSLVGCNTSGLSLLSEMKKTVAWDAMEMKGDMSLDLVALGQTITVLMDYTAYSHTNNMQMEMDLNIKEIKIPDQLKSLFPQPLTFSPIKMYMDGMKFYVSTSFVKEVCALAGVNAEEMMDVTKDYVALDMNSMMEMSGIDISDMSVLTDESYKMFEASKVNLPMTQEGRKYTIELSADQMIDALIAWTQESVNSDMVMNQYKAMGMTTEQINQLKNEVMTTYDQIKPTMKDTLQGSTASVVYEFKDDAYNSTIKGNIKLGVQGIPIELKINCNELVKKVDAREVTFPISVTVYNYEDIIKQLTPSVQFKQSEILQKGDVIYVPFRAAMTQVGAEVTYDAATKKTGIRVGQMIQDIPTIIVNGTAYVAEDILMSLGLGLNIQP